MAEELALILRSARYQDSAKVVTFFSREGGLRTGFARGATARDNRFGASLEPLTLCRISGRGSATSSLYRIHHADIVEPFRAIHADFNLLSWAGLVVRFLLGCLPPDHPEPPLFSLTQATFSALGSREAASFFLWLGFAREALGLLGYRPAPPVCSRCRERIQEGRIFFFPADGTVLCRNCRREDRKGGVEVSGELLGWLSGMASVSELPDCFHIEAMVFLDILIGEINPRWIPAASVSFLPEGRD